MVRLKHILFLIPLTLVILSQLLPAGAQIPTPLPEPAPFVPFAIEAPWPAGINWAAGGYGSFYGDALHREADFYALDFNHPTTNEDAGTLVMAVTDGVVVDADCGDNGSYGCRVVVAHPLVEEYCYQSLYAHLLNPLLVSRGEQVTQGQPLGQVGGTGLPPNMEHLHFAIHRRPLAECNASDSAFRRDMAVVPEPLAGVEPIQDAINPNTPPIISRTYPVGYSELTANQIKGLAELPEPYEAIIETYRSQGGQFGRFGRALGPVKQLGSLHYQEFAPYIFNPQLAWYGLSATIVEYNGVAFFMYSPIWDEYKNNLDRYGLPISHSYSWQRDNTLTTTYRTDFDTNTSLVWDENDHLSIIGDSDDVWEVSMWKMPNHFEGEPYQRRDPYVDLVWDNVSQPGPFTTNRGFSGRWQTQAGGIITGYRLVVKVKGYVRVLVDGDTAIELDSPDTLEMAQSIELGLGAETVEVYYWQQEGSGRLHVTLNNLLPRSVFASEGAISSNSPVGLVNPVYGTFAPAQRDTQFPPSTLNPCPITNSKRVSLHEENESNDNTIFISCIDLTDPYLRFEMVMANDTNNVNANPDQREWIRDMVAREPHALHNPLLAFNADYFGDGHGPEGFTVKNGLRLDGAFSQDNDGNETERVSQAIGRDNLVSIGFRSAEEVINPLLLLSDFYNATGGGPTLVRDGVVIANPCPPEGFSNDDECRSTWQTAIGTSQDGNTYIVITAENKTGVEMGQLLLAHGAYQGMKLDGGGSTQLWYDGDAKIDGDTQVANAVLIFREEIPRHNAFLQQQSRFPVVEPSTLITLSFTLHNTGFLTWEPTLPYGIRNTNNNSLGLEDHLPLIDHPIATNSQVKWVLPIQAPAQPGFYTTSWQMFYSGGRGEELFGDEVEFVITVVPKGTPPNLVGTLQNLVAHVQDEIRLQVDQFFVELEQQLVEQIFETVRRAIPPEFQCLSPISIFVVLGIALTRKRHRH